MASRRGCTIQDRTKQFQIVDFRLQIERCDDRIAAPKSTISNLQSEIAFAYQPLFLRRFFGRGSRSADSDFLLRGLLGSLGTLPLLITAVMKLLIGRLFLHPSIMSQFRHNSPLTSRIALRL
jgi:hypothetical protein